MMMTSRRYPSGASGSLVLPGVLHLTSLLLLLLLGIDKASAQQAPNPLYQIPAFTTPSYDTGNTTRPTTFRNDVCHLAVNANQGNLELPSILEGVELHPLLMLGEFVNMDYEYDDDSENTNTNIVNMTLNPEYPGLIPLLLDELCERAGCTWRNTYAAQGYGILAENQASFDELAIWSTETYDVNLDWWMRSVSRLKQGITFVEKWYDASIILVAKKPSKEDDGQKTFDPLSWLYPFDNNVWYLTLVTVVFSAGVYWFLEYLNPKADADGAQLEFWEAIWMFATAFTGQFEFDPNTHPARLFTFSIAFWALLMSAAYTANLASFLVVANQPTNPIENLGQAVQASIPMCVWKSSQTDSSVTSAFPAYAGSGLLVRVDSQQDVYQGVQDGICDIAITELASWETFQYDNTVNANCNLQWIGRAFEFIPASFIMTNDAGDLCTSLLRVVFDLHLHDMEREGVIADLWEGHIEQTATVFCTGDDDATSSTPDRKRRLHEGQFRHLKAANNAAAEAGGSGEEGFDETTKLSLSNMGGVFLLHGMLSFIAVICAIFSSYREASKQQNENENDNNNLKKESAPYTNTAGSVKEFLGSTRDSVVSDAFFDAVEGTAAVEVLRAEMYSKLEAIDEKLERLLVVQQQQQQDATQRAAIADRGMRLEYS